MTMAKRDTPGPSNLLGAGSSVLVIDDSDVDREAMTVLLEESGIIVHSLPSPIGATRMARDLGVRVVIIDQNLPAMDGSKLAALFRGNPSMRGIRVVLVSGNDDESMFEIAREAQVDAFVAKGRMHVELAKIVRRLM